MALFAWSKQYSVEVAFIDKQHQKLFEMVNELHNAMKAGKGSLLAPEIVKRLAAYTQEHFAAEEDAMKRANYQALASHRAEHDKLIGQVAAMAKGIGDGSVLTMNLQEFLCDWLRTHITLCDKQYSAHLQAAGIR